VHTDGNELAGLLQELFGADVSSAERTCESCRARRPIGAHRLYRGAGWVLRCPACGDLAACIVVRGGGYTVSLRGTWQLDAER
jgi:hypothetical protein